MKLNHNLFLSLLIGLVLIMGCSDQAQNSSNCKSYDGTWQGAMSDSGTIMVTRFTDMGGIVTHDPFLSTYDFQMTIKCSYSDKEFSRYDITHLKASHPIFDCFNGCVPPQDGTSFVVVMANGSGRMDIFFPNGAQNRIFNNDNSLRFTDAEHLVLNIPATRIGSIGSLANPQFTTVEISNCQKLNGINACLLESINPNTITLNKIS